MATAEQYGIRVVISPEAAESGARRVNAALKSIVDNGKAGGAANDNFGKTLDKLKRSSDGFASSGGKVGQILGEISSKSAGAIPGVGGLLNKLSQFGPLGAVVGAVATAIVAIGAASLSAASKQQQWMAQLETMTGSAQKAKESYAALVNFAAKTPFDLGQAVEGFNTLRSLGIEASERALMSFGNTAAAKGRDLKQVIEAVADASTGEFERIKEAFGVTSKTIGDKVKFTFQGVTTTVAKNSKDITAYLVGIGETKFGSAMAKQMDTLLGAVSNVKDNLFQMFAAIGGGKLASVSKDLLKGIAAGIANVTPLLASIGNLFGTIFGYVGKVISGFGELWQAFAPAGAVKSTLDGWTVAFALVGQAVEVAGTMIGNAFHIVASVIGSVMGWARSAIEDLFGWMLPNFQKTNADAALSFLAILRAVKMVAGAIPTVFAAALSDTTSMFAKFGSIVSRLLKGDVSALGDIGKVFSGSFDKTSAAIAKVGADFKTVAADTKAAQSWLDRTTGKGGRAKLDAGIAVAPKTDPKSKADSDAKKRLDQEKEFWRVLENEVETSKLLPLAAADLAKEQELQKILGRDLLASEKARVDTLLEQARTAKFLTGAANDHNQAVLQNNQQEELFAKRLAGMTEEQMAVEKAILDFRLKAGQQGVDLQSEAYKASEAQLRVDEARAGILAKNNALLKQGVDVAGEYSSVFGNWQTQKTLTEKRTALDTAYNGGNNGQGITKLVYEEAVKGLNNASIASANTFRDVFGQKIEALGDQFGGKFGAAISKLGSLIQGITKAAAGDFSGMGPIGGLLDLFKSTNSPFLKAISDNAQKASGKSLDALFTGSTWSNPLKSLSTGFDSFKGDLKGVFGKGGSLSQSLGNVLGKAGMGAQMGETADGLMKALGVKSSKMGAQLGGALGSAIFGPIGGIIGSIGGGLLGGAFKKTKYSTASIGSLAGGELSSSVTGNSSAAQGATTGAGGSVISKLEQIAAALGGSLTGSPSVSIGTYKDSWRVSTTGRTGKLKGKYSDVVDFGKDGAEEAIAFAVSEALKDGVLTGISQFSKSVLSGGMDTDKALSLATSYEAILKDLAAFNDPVKAAVDAAVKGVDTLAEQMKKAGASSTDLANVEAWRARKLSEILKDQVSGFQDLLDSINGDTGGVSVLSQLTTNLSKLDTFKADIASGKAVDQDAFTTLAKAIISQASSIYGTNTSDFQNILTNVKDLTTTAMGNATTQFNTAANGNDATIAALQSQTDAYTAGQQAQVAATQQTNKLLEVLIGKLAGSSGSDSYNGVLATAY